jgi:hypothetical protein
MWHTSHAQQDYGLERICELLDAALGARIRTNQAHHKLLNQEGI